MDKNINIFSYINYIDIIRKMIQLNAATYGYKAQLAEAAGCQRSYISQVLTEATHLTPEHAVGLTVFWNLSASEKDYFLNLVLLARAGSKPLKEFLRQKLETARQDQENLAKRLNAKTTLPEAASAVFYSSWQYLAITILLTIPTFRTPAAIAERLNLKLPLVKKLLQDLELFGVAMKSGSEWHPTSNMIHLPRESPFNSLNHRHWRDQAVQNSFAEDPQAVHYTSVCSLSHSDAEKIKQQVFQLIDESRKTIIPSKEEELFCLTCDWFKV